MVWIQLSLFLVFAAGIYVWMSYGLKALLTKLAVDEGSAWVPIMRHVAVAKAVDVPPTPILVARVVAAIAWTTFATVVVLRGADLVGASSGLATLASSAFAFGIIASASSWIAWIFTANRVEQWLVAERPLWWVAGLVPPLWVSIIAFGATAPISVGPITGEVPATEPDPEEDDATRAIPRVERLISSDGADETVPVPALAGKVNMTTDDYDVTSEHPRVYSPYESQNARPQAQAPAAVEPSLPWDYDDDDATFFAKRRRARWVLRVIGGEDYALEDVTTIGREGIRPIPGVLPIVDDTRTLSKLHARLRREADNWFITDLGSTNGTFVHSATGEEVEVKANTEAKVQGTILLGDLELVIVDQREGA